MPLQVSDGVMVMAKAIPRRVLHRAPVHQCEEAGPSPRLTTLPAGSRRISAERERLVA